VSTTITSTLKPYPAAGSIADSRRDQSPVDPHQQVGIGELLDLALAPLHYGHRLVQAGVEVEVVDLVDAAEAVRVHMHQWQRALVHPGDDKGGRGHLPADAQRGADALDQRGLAGAERTVEDHQVAGPEQAREPAAERTGVVHSG
jgi:hypothetical protein